MSFGIDFGTTNSAVVYQGDLQVGHTTVPTAVAFNALTGDIRYGKAVREQHAQLIQQGWHVVTSIKSCLDDDTKVWRVGNRIETPTSVAMHFFEHLIDFVAEQDRPHVEMTSAVVSIPVGFPASRRKVLRQAASDAGLTIIDFVSESTAAVMHAEDQLRGAANVAVFDWGGGTLDVSVLGLVGRRVRELAIEGFDSAGDKIDRRIAEWVYEQLKPKLINPPDRLDQVPPRDLDCLLVECEQAKRGLSVEPEYQLNLKRFMGCEYLAVELDRARLRVLIQPLLDLAFNTLNRALAAAGLDQTTVDAVLPIGGTCNLIAVQEEIEVRYPAKVVRLRDPDWVVAQGASILAEHLHKRPGETVAKLDQHIGLWLADDTNLPLVKPGDPFNDVAVSHHLGMIEDSDAAQLVYTQSDGSNTSTIGYQSVPMQGFVSERLEVDTTLTRDLTFVAQARSQNGNQNDAREFSYDKLRFLYDLSQQQPSGASHNGHP